MDRVAVFIDNGYFSKVLIKDFGKPRIDYAKFSDSICAGGERFRTYFYDCPPFQSSPPSAEERALKSGFDRFIYNLESLPRFEVRLGRLRKISEPPYFEQKGVDVLLSVDLVRLSFSGKIERAILVTADSDFVPAVNAAKDAGILVAMCYSPTQPRSDELFQKCDERIRITSEIIQNSLLGR
ncbi:MAG: NYN domain-containing protein [Thermoplasmata archaeon]